MENNQSSEAKRYIIQNEESLFNIFEKIYFSEQEFKKKVQEWGGLLSTKTNIIISRTVIDKMWQMLSGINDHELAILSLELSVKLEQNRSALLRTFKDNSIQLIKYRLGILDDSGDVEKWMGDFSESLKCFNVQEVESPEKEEVKLSGKEAGNEAQKNNSGKEDSSDPNPLRKQIVEEKKLLFFAVLFAFRNDAQAYKYFDDFIRIFYFDGAVKNAAKNLPVSAISGELKNLLLKTGAEKTVRKYFRTIEPFSLAWNREIKKSSDLEDVVLNLKIQMKDLDNSLKEGQQEIIEKNKEITQLKERISLMERDAQLQSLNFKEKLDLENEQHGNNLKIEKNALMHEISKTVDFCFSEIRHSLNRSPAELSEQHIELVLKRILITEESINKIKNKL